MEKVIKNFALEPNEETLKQFENCYRENYVLKAALMPDAHTGYVAPIGSVFYVKEHLIPSWVGYDIGCGMIACKFYSNNLEIKKKLVNEVKKKAIDIFNNLKEKIPMGEGKYNHNQNITIESRQKFKQLLNIFKEKEYDIDIYKFIKNNSLSHLGTLGGGNHFIEILSDFEDKELWLVIHSGSRGIGHKVAKKYMKKAVGNEDNFEKTSELSIYSKEGKEYMNILNFGLEFALLNRLEMALKVKNVMQNLISQCIDFELWTNKNHNHAVLDTKSKDILTYIHRKGATPAEKGERGVIPANMRDGCFLVEGLGNENFLYSSSHGAGRVLSRKNAKKKLNMKDFKIAMKGIIGTVNENTLDESPFVYKNIYDVMEMQKESVKIIKHLKPIINWKG